MKLSKTPQLHSFFMNYFLNSDSSKDEQTILAFSKSADEQQIAQLSAQAKILLAQHDLPLGELGSEANRWFSDDAQARAWLTTLLNILEETKGSESFHVKDAHGTLLQEDDAVYVIKDLKVKGSSSDLKRGTLIKKIHLIDDKEAVECRVDGSTLVLKTCFLKKA